MVQVVVWVVVQVVVVVGLPYEGQDLVVHLLPSFFIYIYIYIYIYI